MYRTFDEMWRGWTKNLYLLYRRDLAAMLRDLASLWLFDLLPALAFIALGVGLALGGDGKVEELGAVASLFLVLARLWSFSRDLGRLGFDPRLAWYGPLGAPLFSALLLNSLSAHRLTGRVEWKGRAYSTRGRA